MSETFVCVWWCAICRKCHANACPSLWGGDHCHAPCGHAQDDEVVS